MPAPGGWRARFGLSAKENIPISREMRYRRAAGFDGISPSGPIDPRLGSQAIAPRWLFTVKDERTVIIPVWAGLAGVVIGSAFLMFGARRF
jgi:hypothetical protein